MIGIKGMEFPKSCTMCPAYWEMNAFGLEIEKCRILDKDLKYTISALCPIDPQCPLVDLGKEDMSWDELVEKVKELLIKIHIELETFSLKDYNIKFYKNGHIGVYYDGNYITFITNDGKTNYFQMYQIIKSLVGVKK